MTLRLCLIEQIGLFFHYFSTFVYLLILSKLLYDLKRIHRIAHVFINFLYCSLFLIIKCFYNFYLLLFIYFIFYCFILQFIVVKFLPTQEDDDVYYEVALAKWLIQVDENMIGKIFWPQNDAIAGKLVRSEARANETWQLLEVQVKKYYGMICEK